MRGVCTEARGAASGWSAFPRSRICQAAAGLAVVTLLACALPAASGAAGNSTKGDIDYDGGLPEETESGPLGLLHPHLVVLGDSISSTRGTSLVVRQALRLKTGDKYPPPPYFQGRWSNGLVYTEYLAQTLGLRLVDNAVGGASAGAHNNSILNVVGNFPDTLRCQPPWFPPACPVQVISVPSLADQVAEYIRGQHLGISHQDIMLVEIGSNDVFGGLFGPGQVTEGDYDAFAGRVVDSIVKSLMALQGAGARRFLVFNVPPISRTPLITRLADQDATLPNRTLALVNAINGKLASSVTDFRTKTGAAVVFYANTLLDTQTQPAAPFLGFNNLRDACSTFPIDLFGSPAFAVPVKGGAAPSVCRNPDEYIFWDHVHFTTHFHQLQAGVVAAIMAPLLASFV